MTSYFIEIDLKFALYATLKTKKCLKGESILASL